MGMKARVNGMIGRTKIEKLCVICAVQFSVPNRARATKTCGKTCSVELHRRTIVERSRRSRRANGHKKWYRARNAAATKRAKLRRAIANPELYTASGAPRVHGTLIQCRVCGKEFNTLDRGTSEPGHANRDDGRNGWKTCSADCTAALAASWDTNSRSVTRDVEILNGYLTVLGQELKHQQEKEEK